jgi:hypothetical protein
LRGFQFKPSACCSRGVHYVEAAKIKTLKLKGSVHQQTGALDEFQKDDFGKEDARVLLLLSRDESASGANLTRWGWYFSRRYFAVKPPIDDDNPYGPYNPGVTTLVGRLVHNTT